MQNQPILSIITVCYNDFSGLVRTYKSISNHKSEYKNIEWVVVDGGSTDGTVDFIKSCDLIDCKISEPDNGIYDAMNKGTNIASGKYLMYLNAGDELVNYMVILKNIFCEDNIDLFFFNAIFCYGIFKRIRRARTFSKVKYSIPANHQAIIFRKDALGESPYEIKYKICGDYYLLASLYANGKSHKVINETIVSFMIGGVSTFSVFTLLREANSIQRDVLNLFPLKRFYFTGKRFFSIFFTLLIFKINNIF